MPSTIIHRKTTPVAYLGFGKIGVQIYSLGGEYAPVGPRFGSVKAARGKAIHLFFFGLQFLKPVKYPPRFRVRAFPPPLPDPQSVTTA